MVNMFADPVTMIGGLVQVRTDMHTGRAQLKRTCWSSATVPSIPVSRCQLKHTLLLMQCK